MGLQSRSRMQGEVGKGGGVLYYIGPREGGARGNAVLATMVPIIDTGGATARAATVLR